MKKIIILTALIFLLMVTTVSAEIILDNSTYTTLENAEQSCFLESSYTLNNFNVIEANDSYCIGTFSKPQQWCQRTIRVRNPTHESFPIAVQIIPTPENFPCPSDYYANNVARVRFLPSGSSDRSQFNSLDMNECWEWWCKNVTYTTETRCPFDLGILQWLPFVCSQTNVTIGSPMELCPVAVFTVQPEDDFIDIRFDWRKTPANTIDTHYIAKIKGYMTVYDSKLVTTFENSTLSEGVENYVSGLETITNVNVDFLNLGYMIFEIVAIIIAVIGIPALVIILIKFVWEAVTGRKFGYGGRK